MSETKLQQALHSSTIGNTPISHLKKQRFSRSKKQFNETGEIVDNTTKAKRVNPFVKITQSFNQAKPYIRVVNHEKEKSISILIENVILATLNEILASKETFHGSRLYQQYKENCKSLMEKILKILPPEEYPVFTKPVKITYYRSSSRYIDNDSLAASFKHYTDALVKNDFISLLPDDNPNFIPQIQLIQCKKTKKELNYDGESIYCIGIRLEEIQEPLALTQDVFEQWGFIESQPAVLPSQEQDKNQETQETTFFEE